MEIYRKTNTCCDPLVFPKACRNLEKNIFLFYLIYFASQTFGSYLTPLGEFIIGTEMLKSVNLCVLIQFIMRDSREPSDAVGGSLWLDDKA